MRISGKAKRDLTVAGIVGGVAIGALGLAYAAVPFYFAFCRATGFAGTTQVATQGAGQRGQRTLSVRFNANVAPGLDWSFEPGQESVNVRTGATTTVFFKFHNKTNHETVAHAVYNVTPEISGAYFDKISCFCFTDQKLGPNESAEIPVVFFLDPKLEKDRDMNPIGEITLSYTLFAPPDSEKPVALGSPSQGATPKL